MLVTPLIVASPQLVVKPPPEVPAISPKVRVVPEAVIGKVVGNVPEGVNTHVPVSPVNWLE
jgi:hypothetical protein